jgi:Tol biopolymer transport system component
MPLKPGTRLGPYEILAPVGTGGMGEVWRALDTKLNREVAIKVLPAALANDAQYMARFEREAQTLAALNHPNIATVHGIEQGALVMELVEGSTLQGPLPIDEAIAVARQIAEGLEAAHERGVIHRDLKPANIKVTPAGAVKILDFGLAKTVEPSSSAGTSLSPTLSLAMTQAGAILGTAGYMSPEQARGKPVDRRTDIWAFGVVLYEMLTGELMFHGETVSDILAGVLRAEIDFGKLPVETPENVRRLLRRCLQRDRKSRLTDIGMVRLELDEPAAAAQPGAAAEPLPSRRASWLPWLVAALCASAAGGAVWRSTRPAPPAPFVRLSADIGIDGSLAVSDGGTVFDLSRDGTRLAFAFADGEGKTQIAVRQLDQDRATVLTRSTAVQSPFFSPDGAWIGFYSAGWLKKVRVSGGAPVDLAPMPQRPYGGYWAEDGAIYTSTLSGIVKIPASGGAPQAVAAVRGEAYRRWPYYLPKYDLLLYSAASGPAQWDSAEVVAYSLGTHKRTVLAHGHSPRYIPGFLLYQSANTVFAARFDPATQKLLGEPVPVLSGVSVGALFGALYATSRDGDLVYHAMDAGSAGSSYVLLDEKGNRREVLRLEQKALHPRFSPDGHRVALDVTSSGSSSDIWVKDLERDTFLRLTFLEGRNGYPTWTPDGKAILFQHYGAQPAIYWVAADGSTQPVRMSEAPAYPWSVSPDGTRLALHMGVAGGSMNIFTAAIEGGAASPRLGKPEPVAPAATQQVDASFSPDGRWLAYTSLESGTGQIYVTSYPGTGGRWQVSSSAGSSPRWARDGQELFYRAPEGVMAAPYTIAGGQFVPGKPRLWSNQRPAAGAEFTWDVAPGGKHLVMLSGPGTGPDAPPARQLTFLFHFLDEVRRRTER